MRPILRGASPIVGDFNNYRDAFDHLLSKVAIGEWNGIQISQYCSYCERAIPTNLAVEHIEPKDGQYAQPMLERRWSNFLLSCVNCNSTKSTKEIDFTELYFPDRDNTFLAFEYLKNGKVRPEQSLNVRQQEIAQKTIELVGLDNEIAADVDVVSKDRRSQRLNAWSLALDAQNDLSNDPQNQALHNLIVKGMLANGFFSIWMKAFENYPDIRCLFVDSIKGTRDSGCFDQHANTISPHPNRDRLTHGGKL